MFASSSAACCGKNTEMGKMGKKTDTDPYIDSNTRWNFCGMHKNLPSMEDWGIAITKNRWSSPLYLGG
jgi:hypothetical protein